MFHQNVFINVDDFFCVYVRLYICYVSCALCKERERELMKFNLFKHLMHSMWFQFLSTLKHTTTYNRRREERRLEWVGFDEQTPSLLWRPSEVTRESLLLWIFILKTQFVQCAARWCRSVALSLSYLPCVLTPTLFTWSGALSCYQKAIWSCFRRQFT